MLIIKRQSNCSAKDAYLKKYGYHFNKPLCEFAVNEMHHSNKHNLSWELVMTILEKYNVSTEHPYDLYYVTNMAYNDYYKSSIKDEEHLALFVKDYVEDEDGYEGIPFSRWLADIKHKLISINWEAML